jgi:hypothetical protein
MAIAAALVAAGVPVALAAPSVPAAPATSPAAAKAGCSGKVRGSINGHRVVARSIEVRRISCAKGRKTIRRFFAKADRDRKCNRRSHKPPPSSGCGVGSFNCFRNASTYCASPSGSEVSWRE